MSVEPELAPLVAHLIYRLDVGGLENGLVNLINHAPRDAFRHSIICLTYDTDFRKRIVRSDVPIFALHKPPGNSPMTQVRLWRLLRRLRPRILHSRNLAALEGALTAALAGVPVRIHGEHGRDVDDLDGDNRGRQRLRRLYKPFVHHYVALSKDLEQYLEQKIHVPPSRIRQQYNGVDTDLFHPVRERRDSLPVTGFAGEDTFVIGTVGRMQAVKDQVTLARAFVLMLERAPAARERLRLVMVGEGPLRQEVSTILAEAGAKHLAWLAGDRDDVAQIMRGLDLFVLPSLAEGISNTILEAMASGLPVLATAVGGNGELVEEGRTGRLVPRADPDAMATAMLSYFSDDEERGRHGREARRSVEARFSISAMVNGYLSLYKSVLESTGKAHIS